MRLQLTPLSLVAGLLPARHAPAQDRRPWTVGVASKLFVYDDDDDTTVVSSLTDGEVGLPLDLTLGAHVLLDAVSSASVDVVAAATQEFSETRVETGARARVLPVREADVGLAYVHSSENDWESRSVQGDVGLDLAEKNTRLELEYAWVGNHVGRAGDPGFSERLAVHTVEPSLWQVLDRRTLVEVSAVFQRSDGYHASPYRFVNTSDGRFSTPERHPDVRVRHSAGARLLRHLAPWLAVEASYRFYLDDWRIRSHTGTLALRLLPAEEWDVILRGRAYRQSGADFWHGEYGQPMRYMSADRELGPFHDLGGGAKVAWHRGPWTVDGKLDGVWYRFPDFPRLERRFATVAGIGGGLEW